MDKKQYRLLKDLPNCNKGIIITHDKKNNAYFSDDKDLRGCKLCFTEDEMPLYVERGFFEEVLPVSEPVKERVEPQDITNASKYWEQFRKLPIGNAEMIMHLATYAKQSKQSSPLSGIKEGNGWEIVSLSLVNHPDIPPTTDQLSIYHFTKQDDPRTKNYSIHSVRRLSDNVVFSVGDEVDVTCDDGKGFIDTINHFTFTKGVDVIDVYFKNQLKTAFSIQWLNIAKPTTPAKPIVEETVSSNNDDVACLSLNDLIDVWSGDEVVTYGKGKEYKESPMYKRFEEKAKEKLSQSNNK